VTCSPCMYLVLSYLPGLGSGTGLHEAMGNRTRESAAVVATRMSAAWRFCNGKASIINKAICLKRLRSYQKNHKRRMSLCALNKKIAP